MLSTVITDEETLNQAAEILEATFAAMARVGLDLREGMFDGDRDTRAQAEAFLSDARQFCGELLNSWPEAIAM